MLKIEDNFLELMYDYLEAFINKVTESDAKSSVQTWIDADDNLSLDLSSDVLNFRLSTENGTIDVYYQQNEDDQEYYLDFCVDGESYSGFHCPIDSFSSRLTAAAEVSKMIYNAVC